MQHDPATKVLEDFFTPRVAWAFRPTVALHGNDLQAYVVGVLVEFSAAKRMRKICNSEGRPFSEVTDLLEESDPVFGSAPSFDREWVVRKHLGDFTLFILGMFPRGAANFHRLPPVRALGDRADLAALGKESYRVAAAFDQCEYKESAPLFRALSQRFELCVERLHEVAREVHLQ